MEFMYFSIKRYVIEKQQTSFTCVTVCFAAIALVIVLAWFL